MKPKDNKEREGEGARWTRRSFTASVFSAIGLALSRIVKGEKSETVVSMKEASHYTSLDGNKESE